MGKRDPNEIWDRSVLRKETANTKALYERELGAITKCYFCHPEKNVYSNIHLVHSYNHRTHLNPSILEAQSDSSWPKTASGEQRKVSFKWPLQNESLEGTSP